MTSVLKYKAYAVHGTDWGAGVGYIMYEKFNATARAAHFNFLFFLPTEQFFPQNQSLSPEDQFMLNRARAWSQTGNGYVIEQTTKPNTIGLALQDSPIGQLAWIGEKLIDCKFSRYKLTTRQFLAYLLSHAHTHHANVELGSDPRQGTFPSLLTSTEILRTVSLYYLTQSFTSSVYTYAQNSGVFPTTYSKPPTDAPMLFSNFKWNIGFWPKPLLEQIGNLVQLFCEFLCHFPVPVLLLC